MPNLRPAIILSLVLALFTTTTATAGRNKLKSTCNKLQ
jgi:hypothetical protein